MEYSDFICHPLHNHDTLTALTPSTLKAGSSVAEHPDNTPDKYDPDHEEYQ